MYVIYYVSSSSVNLTGDRQSALGRSALCTGQHLPGQPAMKRSSSPRRTRSLLREPFTLLQLRLLPEAIIGEPLQRDTFRRRM